MTVMSLLINSLILEFDTELLRTDFNSRMGVRAMEKKIQRERKKHNHIPKV